MRSVFAILLTSILLCGCGKFSQSRLERDFGIDLSTEIQTKYSDGCLQIFDISEDSPLYQSFFKSGYKTESVGIGLSSVHLRTSELGEIRYRLLGSFDGYQKVIFYIPKEHILGFGYADAIGG